MSFDKYSEPYKVVNSLSQAAAKIITAADTASVRFTRQLISHGAMPARVVCGETTTISKKRLPMRVNIVMYDVGDPGDPPKDTVLALLSRRGNAGVVHGVSFMPIAPQKDQARYSETYKESVGIYDQITVRVGDKHLQINSAQWCGEAGVSEFKDAVDLFLAENIG